MATVAGKKIAKLNSLTINVFLFFQNQTFAIVDFSNGWEYPDELSLNVSQ